MIWSKAYREPDWRGIISLIPANSWVNKCTFYVDRPTNGSLGILSPWSCILAENGAVRGQCNSVSVFSLLLQARLEAMSRMSFSHPKYVRSTEYGQGYSPKEGQQESEGRCELPAEATG